MKKLFALMMIAVMLIPVIVCACDGIGVAVLPRVETASDMSGEVWVAVQKSTGFLFGMLSPTEAVSVYPAQSDAGRIRGITAQGINRAKGEMRYIVAEETVCGLTRVMASVNIAAEYMDVVTAIVHRNMGEGAEVTASTVVSCTIRLTSCTVTHRMVGRNANKVAVGQVLFCGAEMAATLYIADWDGDGQLDLCLSVNPGSAKTTPAPTSTPKPSKTNKPTPKPTATTTNSNQNCLKIMIQINIEKLSINHLNIDSIFKPCGKVEGC